VSNLRPWLGRFLSCTCAMSPCSSTVVRNEGGLGNSFVERWSAWWLFAAVGDVFIIANVQSCAYGCMENLVCTKWSYTWQGITNSSRFKAFHLQLYAIFGEWPTYDTWADREGEIGDGLECHDESGIIASYAACILAPPAWRIPEAECGYGAFVA
jgi:hypothetical protein